MNKSVQYVSQKRIIIFFVFLNSKINLQIVSWKASNFLLNFHVEWSTDFAAIIMWPTADELLSSLFSNNLLL